MSFIVAWLIVVFIAVLFACIWVQKRYGWFAAIMVAYPMAQYAMFLWGKGSIFAKQFAAMSITNFICILVVAHFARKLKHYYWLYIYGAIAVFIVAFGSGERIIGNHSMAVCALAIALPYMIHAGRWWPLFIWGIFSTALISQTSIGLFGVVLACVTYFFLTSVSYKTFLIVVIGSVIFIGVGYYAYPSELFNDSNRYIAWKAFLERIPSMVQDYFPAHIDACHSGKQVLEICQPVDYANILFGHGIGSFLFLNLKYLNLALFGGVPFWDAHNDFLQIFFEMGPVYFVLVLSFIPFLIYMVFKRPRYISRRDPLNDFALPPLNTKMVDLSVLLTFCAIAVFNFPLHNVFTCFPVAVAALSILDRTNG